MRGGVKTGPSPAASSVAAFGREVDFLLAGVSQRVREDISGSLPEIDLLEGRGEGLVVGVDSLGHGLMVGHGL